MNKNVFYPLTSDPDFSHGFICSFETSNFSVIRGICGDILELENKTSKTLIINTEHPYYMENKILVFTEDLYNDEILNCIVRFRAKNNYCIFINEDIPAKIIANSAMFHKYIK